MEKSWTMQFPRFLQRLRRRDALSATPARRIRSLFTTNPLLKAFSLLLAILMWGFVTSQKLGVSTELKFSTPLVLKNIPKELEVISSVNQSVSVLVRLRKDVARRVNPNQFRVGIDMRNQLAGRFEYTLSRQNVSYDNDVVPDGVEILQISPVKIPLELEETFQKTVQIKPRFEGNLPKGFTIDKIDIVPKEVVVRGPHSHVEGVRFVSTRPLDVEGLKSDVEMLVMLDLPPTFRLATPNESFFRAHITVSHNPTRVLFHDIPIVFENARFAYRTSTKKINVHLEGPRELILGLKQDSIFAVVDMAKYPPGDYRNLSPRVVAPDTVKVLEQWPILDLFVLKRKIESS